MQNIKLEEVSTGTKWWEKPINRNNVLVEKSVNEIMDLSLQLSNPNLLMNGGFLINQREQNQYNKNYDYTVDRWMLFNMNIDESTTPGILNVCDGYVELTNMGDRQLFINQYLREEASLLRGRTVTFSVEARVDNMTQGNLFFQFGYREPSKDTNNKTIVDNSQVTGEWKRFSVTTIVPDTDITMIWVSCGNFNNPETGYLPVNANCKMHFRNAKLEIGDKVTPYHPRPLGEELSLCKRYYEKYYLRGNYIGGFSTHYYGVSMGITKRVVPTISILAADVSGTETTRAVSIFDNDVYGFSVHINILVGDSNACHRFQCILSVDAEIY